MLSDATGVRAYAGVMPARTLAQMHQSGYGACKDAAERANIAETRHLAALWRITTASRLVAKDCEQRRLRLGLDDIFQVIPAGRTCGRHRARARSAMRDELHEPGGPRASRRQRRDGCPAERKEGGAAESAGSARRRCRRSAAFLGAEPPGAG
jgi:hypothetical protein